MKTQQPIAEIQHLDDGPYRWAYLERGIVRYVGSEEECQRRFELSRSSLFTDRDRQDKFLGRAIGGLLLLLLAAPAWAEARVTPDPNLTPGVANSEVTQDNLDQTICVPGWTKTIRPSASYTNALKRQQMPLYGLAGEDPGLFEEDHLISLELGGHPTDPKNLWPEPWAGDWGARRKDRLETTLKRLVCAGQVDLIDAQNAIRTDWIAAYHLYVLPEP